MILAIGEILVDIFPHYRRIGGAPFNFAYHAGHLGMDVTFISRVGDDEPGADIFAMLAQNGFKTEFIQIDRHHETGRVIVTPDQQGGHEFEILPDAAYDFIDLPDNPEDISGGKTIDLIYFGTLAQRTAQGFNSIQAFLNKRPAGSKCFYDINLRPGQFSDAIIRKSLDNTDILKLNSDELAYLRHMFRREDTDTRMARWLMQNCGIEMVSLTKGADGSDIITAGDQQHAGVPDAEIADTVGAGDAYAAVLATGLLKGLPLEKILSIAARFASKICTIKGAVPDDTAFYEPFRKQLSGDINA